MTRAKLCDMLCITRPTLLKLLNNPELFNGIQRSKFAKAVELPISVIDIIISGKHKISPDEIEQILEYVKPLNKK
jgi:predicted transcriptional regulator